MEARITATGILDFSAFEIEVDNQDFQDFLSRSELIKSAKLIRKVQRLGIIDNRVSFRNTPVDSYFTSADADFIRVKLLSIGKSFSFETVMSHPSKIDFLREVHAAGYRNYLYFIATKDPLINKSRVEARVKDGGHDVPAHKIKQRYLRTKNEI